MARPIEHAGDDVVGLDALLLGDGADILGRGFGEVDRPFGIARPDGKLVHIDVGRIEEAALLGDGEDGERVGPGLGGYGGALQRIERDVDARPAMIRLADLLADIEHRRLVPLTFADRKSTRLNSSY